MMTSEPEPMNGPPSWRCQIGAGKRAISTSRPATVFSRNAAVLTVTGGCGLKVLRFSIQAFSASSGRSVGSSPSASAARCTLVVALVKMRKPRRKAFDAVEQQRRAVGQAGRDLGDTADLEARIGAFDAPQGPELVDGSDEFAQVFKQVQVLIHGVAPAICRKPSHACARLRWQVKEFSFLANEYK